MTKAARTTSCLNRRGFTLLEVMVSIIIFALVATILFSGFHLTTRAWKRGQENIQKGERIRGVMELIRRQIVSTYPVLPLQKEDQQTQDADGTFRPVTRGLPYFVGAQQRMAFVTLYSLRLNAIPGLCFVVYGIENSEDGEGFQLVEYENQYTGTNPMGNAEGESLPDNIFRYVLLDHLDAAAFRFYGMDYSQIGTAPPEEMVKSWFESWDVETMGDLPEAVEITYHFLPGFKSRYPEGRVLVPIRSHGANIRPRAPRSDAVANDTANEAM